MTKLLVRTLAVLALVTGLASCAPTGTGWMHSPDAPGDMPGH